MASSEWVLRESPSNRLTFKLLQLECREGRHQRIIQELPKCRDSETVRAIQNRSKQRYKENQTKSQISRMVIWLNTLIYLRQVLQKSTDPPSEHRKRSLGGTSRIGIPSRQVQGAYGTQYFSPFSNLIPIMSWMQLISITRSQEMFD